MKKTLYFAFVFVFSTSLYAGEAAKQVGNAILQNAYSYGDSAVESWARDNLKSLRLIELETRSRSGSKPTFRAITLFELTGDEFNKILSQVSYSTFNDRETLNTGLIYRGFNQDMTKLYGINVFYDHEFDTGHARTGLGFEMKSSVYDININLYEAMTEKHHVDGAPEIAAGGYDAEIGALLPYLPWARVYYKRYQWNNETLNIRNGETISLYMEPTSRLSVEAGMQDDSTLSSHKSFIKLNYIVCCNERKSGPGLFSVSSNAYNYGKLDSSRMYEKVRRENNIVKVKGGGAITVQASGF